MMQPSRVVWLDGELKPWDEATVHVGAHGLHYGSSVFEGIRAYKGKDGPAILCLEPHLDRLWTSCKVYRMEVPFSREQMRQAILETIRANGHRACYIRPVVFRGWGTFALDGRSCPTHTSVITIEMGQYLGNEALEYGVEVGVSSWRRMAPGTLPAAAKIGGQYINSQMIVMEAVDHGFTEGIALDVSGYVSEGSGENIFLVRSGELYTPPLANSILDGITRRCVITLAEEEGLSVQEAFIPRELLYSADELFFTGTAAEITPIRAVDGITIGQGKRGPVTARLQRLFFEIIKGEAADRHGWLTPVAAR